MNRDQDWTEWIMSETGPSSHPSEFAMKLGRSAFVCRRRFNLRLEDAKVLKSAAHADLSAPLVSRTGYPLKPGGIVFRFPTVELVLRRCGKPKVRATVVQAVAIDVVNKEPRREPQKCAMHMNMPPTTTNLGSDRVNCFPVRDGAPVASINERHICCVDHGLVASRKRDVGNVALNADWSGGARHLFTPDDVEGLDVRGANRASGFAFNGDGCFQRSIAAIVDLRQRALRDADARGELGLCDADGFQVRCELVFHAA